MLAKAQFPEDLAQRIANAERGMFDDDDDVAQAAKDGRGAPAGAKANGDAKH